MLRRPNLAALIAGLLSATGFAPLNWWLLLLVGLAVLLHLTHEAPSLKSAVLRGWMFGLGHFTVGSNWLQHAFDFQDKMPPALGYLAVVLVACYLAIYPAIAMGLAWWFKTKVEMRSGWLEPDAGYVFAAAAAWMLSEWLRGWMFTGYPWDPIGVAWVTTPVAAIAALIGTYALSGVTMVVAGALYLAARHDYRLLAGTVPALIVASIVAIPGYAPSAGAPKVRVVQPNIGQEAYTDPDYSEKVLARMLSLSGTPSLSPRLLVWPEGMVNDYVEDGYPDTRYYAGRDPRMIRARIAAKLGPLDTALISGNALFFDRNAVVTGAGNAIWPLDPDGVLGERYDKAHLVPFGEYLPVRAFFEALGVDRFAAGDIDFVRGPGPRSIEIPGFGAAGMDVCYEIAFSGHVVDPEHRPDFIFNPSNDSWFGSWGPAQHLAQARMRAIEEGLPILRATPTGISAVIDARGRLVATIPLHVAGAVEVPLPPPLPPTLFSKLGNWLALAAFALLLLLAVAFRRFAR